MKMYGMDGFDALKYPRHVPAAVKELPADCDIFEEIRKGDVLLHHPYQTFDPVVKLVPPLRDRKRHPRQSSDPHCA